MKARVTLELCSVVEGCLCMAEVSVYAKERRKAKVVLQILRRGGERL